MTKTKKKLIVLLACLAFLAFGLAILAACGDSGDYTVTFMVYDEDAEQWEQYGNPVSTNGGDSITMPLDPSRDYYRFRGWYEDEDFTVAFENTGIDENKVVYARFAAIEVTVHYNDINNTYTLESVMEELTAEYEASALANSLTFDGWYTDSGYTTPYSGQDTDNLYARDMAQVTYYNGYETLYTTLVQVGTTTSEPAADDIVKYYMDEEDISYACTGEDGWALADEETGGSVAFDFNEPITQNTTITVLWKTPHLLYYYDPGNDTYICIGVDYSYYATINTYPAFSILSENVTISRADIHSYSWNACVNRGYGTPPLTSTSGMKFDVKTVWIQSAYLQGTKNWDTIIFANGIQVISCFVPTYTDSYNNTATRTIYFPSSLKVIENSFNDYTNLSEVNLPDGLEVLVMSFRGCTNLSELAVPDSVYNVAGASEYFTFSENSTFVNEGNGRIYQYINGDKILIMDHNITEDGVLYVEEGVTSIQIGAFEEYKDVLTYLYLPSSFSSVSYNASIYVNQYYPRDIPLIGSSINDRYLFSSEEGYADPESCSLIYWLEDEVFLGVIIDLRALPEGVSEYIFGDYVNVSGNYSNTYAPYTYETLYNLDKVLFVGEIPDGQDVNVAIRIYDYTNDNESRVETTIAAGDYVTMDWLMQATGLDQHAYFTRLEVTVVTEIGEEYVIDGQYTAIGPVNRNLYIYIEYEYTAGGFTWQLSEDGKEITVKGFNISTAFVYDGGSIDGLYLVVIPAEIDGIPVTTIAENAFSGEWALYISAVIIGENVKTIGNGAFKDTIYMNRVVIESRVLEYIGDSAFENSGFTSIALPLANLTYIGPYAFKSETLRRFYTVEGEEARGGSATCLIEYIYDENGNTVGTKLADWVEEGAYYFLFPESFSSSTGYNYGILQYVGTTTIQMPAAVGSDEMQDIQQHDVRLIAVAGGYVGGGGGLGFNIGYTKNRTATGTGEVLTYMDYTVRYEVMTGSVYYLSGFIGLKFANVSYIHENAFTDMGSWAQTVYVIIREANQYHTLEEIQSMDPSIFAEGWWDGLPNDSAELSFMKSATERIY